MPFKLRLKKSRHYNVISKSLFIISVEALDNTSVECTLSSESTGLECLECACQKLSINQPQFFGLQYQCRSGTLKWLEMDRPVKRQLDKHATRTMLYMRVMYYVHSGTSLITDELARYHYFLQLKMDVAEGRIACSPKQAVQLAGYCMQAELGNYDAEKHTPDYLKDFHLFPRTPADGLMNAAIHQHAALYGLPQSTAEERFIRACQQLDGYGVELFSARDSSNNEVTLGLSLTGVQARGENIKVYLWADVANVFNHKRTFGLEFSASGSPAAVFTFEDADEAKRTFRTAVLQHMFYRKYEAGRQQQQQQQQIEQPQEEPEPERVQSSSCLDLSGSETERLRNLLPSYRPAPDYETAVQQKYRRSAGATYSSQPDVTHGAVFYNGGSLVQVYKPPPPYPSNRLSSSSTPDLAVASRAAAALHAAGSSPDLVQYVRQLQRLQLYCVPAAGGYVCQREQQQQQQQEPIYENIPVQWRARTQSVQSAPESVEREREQLQEEVTCVASSTASSSSSKKRFRWGLLAATLGRPEKTEKTRDPRDRRHRWSTGLPRAQPLPGAASDNQRRLLEQKLADGRLLSEFESVLKRRSDADFGTALSPAAIPFNRFRDALPYEDNRVKLIPSADNRLGYVNASHITATVAGRQLFYIAAQGPGSAQTAAAFWQCIWEAEVYLVVQLTDAADDAAGGGYFPLEGPCRARRDLRQRTGRCVASQVRLSHSPSRTARSVWHLHYADWAEQGCPRSVPHFLAFLEELRSVRQHALHEIPPGHNRNPPVLVHCTAGVGRTGLAILADILLHALDHNQEIDVPRTLAQLRHQRAHMLQTYAQYRFVHQLLLHYLKQTRLI